MAGRRTTRIAPTTFAQTPGVDDPKVQRALDVVSGAIQELQGRVGTSPPETVTGSRASGAALESLLAKLEALGIIVDDTEA